jgi:hypothetical protein
MNDNAETTGIRRTRQEFTAAPEEGGYLANTDPVTISQHGSSLSRVAADNNG